MHQLTKQRVDVTIFKERYRINLIDNTEYMSQILASYNLQCELGNV